jgi:hypothetical protein
LTIDPTTAPQPLLEAYTTHARRYDERTVAFQRYRRMIVEALPVCQGDVVIDRCPHVTAVLVP